VPADFSRAVTGWDRREMLDYSRALFAQLANLGSAILEKNWWAFGDSWEPYYTGSNRAWGEEASAFLREQFFPHADRHGRHDWLTLLYLSGIAWDRDGDDLMLLTEDERGFPKVEMVSGARIGDGQRGVSGGRVTEGRWAGRVIRDGIIFDGRGTPVAARVLGLDEDGVERYEDYSIGFGGRADLAYLPEWHDQGRGIPLVGRCQLDWMDLQDIDTFLKRGIKRATAVGLVRKNLEGEAPVGNEIVEEVLEGAGAGGGPQRLAYEEQEGGEVYWLRAEGGESIEGLNYSTPHPNVESFIARIERRGVKAVGWAYELLYLNESGRAATRLVVDLGNQSIWKQQRLGLRRTWRVTRYALAKGMKEGFLSRNPDPRDAFFAWDFGLPAPLSVDAGNDEQADRENLKMGTTTKALIAQKQGRHWQEVARQRKVEILALVEDAREIEAASGGRVSFERALELLEQRSPNPAGGVRGERLEGRGEKEVAEFRRAVWLGFQRDGTVSDVLANQTDLKRLTEEVGLPVNEGYDDPYLPVRDDAGALVGGGMVRDEEGDVIGAKPVEMKREK
jgi:hypothetical protein